MLIERDDDGYGDLSVDLDAVSGFHQAEGQEGVNIVIIPKSRHSEQSSLNAKIVELQKLKDFETYEEVNDQGQNTISSAWVLCQKGEGVRAWLIARDFEKDHEVQKDSPAVSNAALRAFLAVAVGRQWTVKTTDVKSALLQGKPLDREVSLQLSKEAATSTGKLWRLRHCLYGLSNAAKQFFQSVMETVLTLDCKQCKFDPAPFVCRRNGHVVGMIVSYMVESLHAGEGTFDQLVMKKLRERFLAGG